MINLAVDRFQDYIDKISIKLSRLSNIQKDDLRQEAYLKILNIKNILEFPDEYVRKAILNHLINFIRKEKKRNDIPLSNLKIME